VFRYCNDKYIISSRERRKTVSHTDIANHVTSKYTSYKLTVTTDEEIN